MTTPSYPIALLLVLATAGVTAIAYIVVRPTPPERMKNYGGPIGVLGRWLYFIQRPLVRIAIALRLTANAMSGAGVIFGLGAGGLAAMGLWGWAGLSLAASAWCDAIDGEIARATRTQGKAGAFLDSNLDRIIEIALFAGITWGLPDRTSSIWAMAALASSFMVSYARARGEGLGVACPNFGMERPHRVVLLLFALLAAPFLGAQGSALVVESACAIVTLGASATAVGRMFVIHHKLRRQEDDPRGSGPAGPA
jgi:CDP-diacylglycerol---glycerol-3-phosphate 3-phosphatidyltransferase